MSVIVIYDGPNACQRCLGWKQVDDGGHQSWKYWANLPSPSDIAVRMGLVRPVQCPDCKGSGVELSAKEKR